jgi:hypothetical protein
LDNHWTAKGRGLGHVKKSGRAACHGSGVHSPVPAGLTDLRANIDFALLKRIQAAECSWSLYAATDSELNIDPFGDGLYARIKGTQELPAGMIKFHANEEDALYFTLVVPDESFQRYRHLIELVLLSDSLEFELAVEFPGFRVPNSTSKTPTWEEFINGVTLFTSEVSLSVHVGPS